MDKWDARNRPSRLERRFEFESYERTRDFLDSLGNLSELKKIFPDISCITVGVYLEVTEVAALSAEWDVDIQAQRGVGMRWL